MSEQVKEVLAALTRAPAFKGVTQADVTLTRLGRLTNLVHLVDTGSERIIVRIPGAVTEDYIDRKVEAVNAKAAADAGVCAELIWDDPASGVMIPRAIDDIVTMTPQLLAGSPAPLMPCHRDPLCENFLDEGAVMWIVDWAYSGMNDPLWDVGDLSAEAGFDPRLEAELMQGYFGRAPMPAETGRIAIYKAMCDLLWTLWGLIQHADGNPAENIWAYSTERFALCTALMNDPAWDGHLAAVQDS